MKRAGVFIATLLIGCVVFGQRQTQTITFKSKVFGENRTVKISLPEGYEDFPNRKYIVAYLFDAQSDAFFNFIKATVDYLTADGYIQPLILVGIASTNRQYEFTPKAQTVEGAKYFQKSGGADSLVVHLESEVLPLIQNKYRCSGYNLGIGHSLGGTFLTYSLIRHPELFNAHIVISPNYHYDNEQLVHTFDSLTNPAILDHKFLYIAHGYGDMYEERFKPATQRMDSLLANKKLQGLKWQVKSLDNDSHGTTATEGIFKGLVTLFRQFTLPYERFKVLLDDTTKPFLEQVQAYYQVQSAWAGMPLPMVNDINGLGYNCFYAGKTKEAIQVFQWALSLYPDDANLYDSMGEIQQSAGNNKEALHYYSKGLDVVQKQKPKLQSLTYQRLIKGFKERIHSVGISR